jgi:hypothetical protein
LVQQVGAGLLHLVLACRVPRAGDVEHRDPSGGHDPLDRRDYLGRRRPARRREQQASQLT